MDLTVEISNSYDGNISGYITITSEDYNAEQPIMIGTFLVDEYYFTIPGTVQDRDFQIQLEVEDTDNPIGGKAICHNIKKENYFIVSGEFPSMEIKCVFN